MRSIDLPDFNRRDFTDRFGPWALIAGASEGSGACYARQLGAMGFNLVLVSRRHEALNVLGAEIAGRHQVSYRAVVQDLKVESAGAELDQRTADLDVGLFIYNAGTDGAGNSFLATPVEQSHGTLIMNTRTVTDSVHAFGNRFKARGRGGIILMSSGAGLGGQPWLAMYSATKAFEINLAESLWAEFQDINVDILAMVAPGMDTPALRRNIQGSNFDMGTTYNPDDVVHMALARLGHAPIVVIPDGPKEENLARVEADRIERLILLAEWAKSYTSGAAV